MKPKLGRLQEKKDRPTTMAEVALPLSGDATEDRKSARAEKTRALLPTNLA